MLYKFDIVSGRGTITFSCRTSYLLELLEIRRASTGSLHVLQLPWQYFTRRFVPAFDQEVSYHLHSYIR